jgi:hypothetical protein
VGWIAVAFGAGLLGGVAATLLQAPREHPGDATVAIDGLDALDRHVQELTHELQALRTGPAQPALRAEPQPGAAVEPLRSSGDADLAALVARLDRLLAEPPRLGAPEVAALVIPDAAATEAARRALIHAEREDVNPEIRLMTYQQIAERFGRPSRISREANGDVSWFYDDASDDEMRQMTFIDGLLADWY